MATNLVGDVTLKSKQQLVDVGLLYNDVCTTFISNTLDDTAWMTIFRGDVTAYIEKWMQPGTKPYGKFECRLCKSVLCSGRLDPGQIEKMAYQQQLIRHVANRMPHTTVGVVLCWLNIKQVLGLCQDKAILIDPESILVHYLLAACPNVVRKNQSFTDTIPKTMRVLSKIRNGMMHPEEEEEEDDPKQQQSDNSDELDMLKTFVRKYHEHTSGGGCCGYDIVRGSRCINSQTGSVEINGTRKMLPVDGRYLISPDWLCKQFPDLTYEQIMDDEHYMVSQPALEEYIDMEEHVGKLLDRGKVRNFISDMMTQSAKLPPAKRPRQDSVHVRHHQQGGFRSLFAIEGELKEPVAGSTMLASRIDKLCQKAKEVTEHCMRDMTKLYDLHTLLKPSLTDNNMLSYITYAISPLHCMWCTLEISPRVRPLIQDLGVMARACLLNIGFSVDGMPGQYLSGEPGVRTVQDTGMRANDTELAAKHSPRTARADSRQPRYRLRYEKARKALLGKRGTAAAYSHNFDANVITKTALHARFIEWCQCKYPFLSGWLQQLDLYGITLDTIHQHLSFVESKCCAISTRRSHYECDTYLNDHHTCLLPLLTLIHDVLPPNKFPNGKMYGVYLFNHHLSK